jgi:putative endonuclease
VSRVARRPARTRARAEAPAPAPGARRPRAPPRGGWWVYLLACRDGSLYAGSTNDLARRVATHARGRGGRYTRSRLPVALVHSERAADRGAALRREAALKRLTRAEKLALVAGARPPRRRRAPAIRNRGSM